MINVVSWNIGKQKAPWHELVRMAGDGDADVALVQEAGSPPRDVVDLVDYDDHVFWDRHVYDRWPLVVKLSDRIMRYFAATSAAFIPASLSSSARGTPAMPRISFSTPRHVPSGTLEFHRSWPAT